MLFDTHAHLDQEEFIADLPMVIDRAKQSGVERIVCVGIDLSSSLAAVGLAEKYSEIFAAVGIHPNSIAKCNENDWKQIIELTSNPRVIAIGETGLDRYWDDSPIELQKEYFERHLDLSQMLNLPVIIHCRDAAKDLMPMLRLAASEKPLKGILHAFSGDSRMAEECVALGLHISFAGNVTYKNKKFQTLQSSMTAVPLDRLLIETDSPYLTPEPLRGKQKRNEPAFITHTALRIAELYGIEPAELICFTSENANRLFSL